MESGQDLLRFGPFRVDAFQRLWRGDQLVDLAARPLAVLCYLAERPGQMVTKQELLRELWAGTYVTRAVLKVAVRSLREALGEDARAPQYIETVGWEGYRFLGKVVSDQLSVVSKGDGVVSSQYSVVSSQEEDRNTKQAEGLKPKAKGSPLPSPSTRFWLTKGIMLLGLLLLVGGSLIVHYFSLLIPSPQPLTPSTQELPLSDKPSIAVMPFTNMSGDPEQEYFSDGLTDDLITDLSRLSQLFVIARHSTFTYKGKAAKVQDISKELGVRYVLEGSVRKTEDQVRINAQLVDATTGHHLWAERYDRPLKDIFALQDEIVQKIVTTLKLQLTLREQGVLVRKTTDNLEAYDTFLRGVEYFHRATQEAHAQARQMFEKAVELDPQYAVAYACLGQTSYLEWAWRWNAAPRVLERALALGQKAVTLDDSLPLAHSLLSGVYALKHQYDQAIAEGERATALDPNNADSYAFQAEVLNIVGRPVEALRVVEQAMRLNPRYPPWYLLDLGWAYRLTGRPAEAVATLKEALRRSPNHPGVLGHLLLSYIQQWASQQSADAQALEQALATAQRLVTLNDSSSVGHTLLGIIYQLQKQYESALAEGEQAIALDSTFSEGYATLAEMLSCVGRSEEALRMVEQALYHKPVTPDAHLSSVGAAYYLAGRPEEAIAPLKQYLSRYPNILKPHLTLAAVYSELGKEAEAQAEAAEVLRLNPKFSLEVHKQRAPIKDPTVLERHIAALREAGLK
jgi:TolB-like protein/DNA-binding winged helix-turn-helix (wHTH) protein/Flp pilus assembly protein TadD